LVFVALWIFVTVCPTLILNSKQVDQELVSRDFAGWTVWGIGFLIEAIADYQKYIFRSNPANADKWITTGLWSVVRHPNYLGEILMWFGLFISASTTFKGWEYLSLISPFFIAFLLTKVSGIPFLERRALKRWKDNPEFVTFLNNSYRLIPFLY
jgi:steroid 5-alpha reductase family enzyme